MFDLSRIRYFVLFLLFMATIGCQSTAEPTAVTEEITLPTIPPTETATITATETALPTPQITELTTNTPPPTVTTIPTATATETAIPTETATAVPTLIPSATATNEPPPAPTIPTSQAGSCIQPNPADDNLLAVVTKTYGLSATYKPPNLVPLAGHFDSKITFGYPTLIREIAIEPLRQMVTDMQAAGLNPQIISGYRSYSTQEIAFQKWVAIEPERAEQLSARPGHSEHQLGTTLDFGSPTLQDYVETELTSQFHTYFFKTPEGTWLIDNAHRYGFTLSYPREAGELTGFYYEPWHYRYVGIDTATELKNSGVSLTQYQLQNFPPPCAPQTVP